MPLVTEDRYRALFYMPLYTFLHHVLNVLVQVANQIGLNEKLHSFITRNHYEQCRNAVKA
jgi:hypothetical protein